jgi:hypothetical protein
MSLAPMGRGVLAPVARRLSRDPFVLSLSKDVQSRLAGVSRMSAAKRKQLAYDGAGGHN